MALPLLLELLFPVVLFSVCTHNWIVSSFVCRLNEGFTVFVERKILGRMQGKQHSEFSAIIGLKALVESVELYGPDHPFTALCPRLQEQDPDDAFSSVPYGTWIELQFILGLLDTQDTQLTPTYPDLRSFRKGIQFALLP
jgi:hypothetical protein